MGLNLKLALIISLFSGTIFVLSLQPAHAQEDLMQEREGLVAETPADDLDFASAPVVIELFSSQACVFCPKADALLGAEIKTPDVIAIACHVDYFDVKTGSLAQHFCTERQDWYMEVLRAGPNYTPQLVVNGQYDVVGHKENDVRTTIDKASDASTIKPLSIKKTGKGQYQASWQSFTDDDDLTAWVFLLDKPHPVKIAEGRNKGTETTYLNIASSLQKQQGFNPQAGTLSITVEVQDAHQTLVVLVQEEHTGKVVAAGQSPL